MKNPKSNYVSSVRKVLKARQIRNIIILSASIFLALVVLLILYMSFLKEDIDRTFQNEETTASVLLPNPSAEETDDTSISGIDVPPETGYTPDPVETHSLRDEDLAGYGFFEDTDHFIFDSDSVLQTVTYGERDIAFAQLKQSIRQYIENESEARISIHYINLQNNEAFGFNDLSPFVFAGSMNLPINLVLYDQIAQGHVQLTDLIMYPGQNDSDAYSLIDDYFLSLDEAPVTDTNTDNASDSADADEIEDLAEDSEEDDSRQRLGDPNKERLLSIRELSYLSIVHGDASATAMLINHLGGIEVVNERLLSISGAVDFLSVRHYTDFEGVQHSGSQRSSTFDMAHFCEYLYFQYRMNPEIYQPLINDLSRSEPNWGISDGLSDHVLYLNKNGVNTTFASMSDLAIVIAAEPYVLCIAVEAENDVISRRVIKDLSEQVDAYFAYCFS